MLLWSVVVVLVLAVAKGMFRTYVLQSEVRRLAAHLGQEREARERDVTFIEDYFDRCEIRPKGPRIHCGTTWCSRPDGHPGDCK